LRALSRSVARAFAEFEPSVPAARALMSRAQRRFPPPWTVEEPESRLPVQARRIRMDEGHIAERPLIGP